MRVHPFWQNVFLGMIEAGSIGLLLAIVVGSTLADADAPSVIIAVGIAVLLLGSLYVVGSRYSPMFVVIDSDADEIRYRNAWHRGSFRWSEVQEFHRSQIFLGHDVARAKFQGGRSVRLRAAPFDEFIALVQRLAPSQ